MLWGNRSPKWKIPGYVFLVFLNKSSVSQISLNLDKVSQLWVFLMAQPVFSTSQNKGTVRTKWGARGLSLFLSFSFCAIIIHLHISPPESTFYKLGSYLFHLFIMAHKHRAGSSSMTQIYVRVIKKKLVLLLYFRNILWCQPKILSAGLESWECKDIEKIGAFFFFQLPN